jgi:GNAT superfamily N-acetyltransferase
MSAEYRIEKTSAEHFQQLQELFARAYGVNIDPKALEKKYDTLDLGASVISYVAIHKNTNRVVSHFGACPLMLRIDGSEVLGAQSIDAATDKQHRGKGLFRLLAEQVHQECRNKNVKMVFSQPNASSYHAFINNFGFERTDEIIRWDMKLALKTFPLYKAMRRIKTTSVYYSYAQKILKNYLVSVPDDFSSSLPVSNGRVLRNTAYLQYKNSADKFFIRIEDVTMWIKLSDIFWIGDISDHKKFNELVLQKLIKLAFSLGLNTISFHLNEKVEHPEFLRHFKIYQREPSCFLYLDPGYKGQNLLLTGADFDTW